MLIAWLVVLAAVVVGAATLSKPTSDSLRIPGTPAQNAIDLLGERFPQLSAGGANARVVFAASLGQTLNTAALKAAVEKTVANLKAAPEVATVTDPYQTKTVNPAGTIGYAQVGYRVTAGNLSDAGTAGLDHAVARARTSGPAPPG